MVDLIAQAREDLRALERRDDVAAGALRAFARGVSKTAVRQIDAARATVYDAFSTSRALLPLKVTVFRGQRPGNIWPEGRAWLSWTTDETLAATFGPVTTATVSRFAVLALIVGERADTGAAYVELLLPNPLPRTTMATRRRRRPTSTFADKSQPPEKDLVDIDATTPLRTHEDEHDDDGGAPRDDDKIADDLATIFDVPSTYPARGEAVGGANASALAAAAKTDGATFVRSSKRARAHVRRPPPSAPVQAPIDAPAGVEIVVGAPCDLLVGQDVYRGGYLVVEADLPTTSHVVPGFAADPHYPADVQERDYTRDPHERRKVEDNAARLIPAYLINTNPDSVNGPPIVALSSTSSPDRALIVMGGNSRAMSLRLAYRDGHAAGYRALLVERADVFGVDRKTLDAFAAPVLVRAFQGLPLTRDMSRALNESQTLDKSATVDAVSAAARVSARTLAILMERIDPDVTLSAFLTSPQARAVVASLVEDRVISRAEAPRYLRGPDLSDDGAAHVERVLLSLIIPDAITIDSMTPRTRDVLARCAPAIFEARRFGHDIADDVRAAVEDLADAHARGVSPESLDVQGSMFAETMARSRTDISRAMRRLLQQPARCVRVLRTFASMSRDRPAAQRDLLDGEAPTTAALFASALAVFNN